MSSPLAVYKLIILYLLDKTDGEIAMDRLSSFLLERGYVNFVSLMETYAQIEESGLVRSRVSGDRCFYAVTAEGRQTLKLLGGQLSRDIRDQADEFLASEGAVLRNEQAVRADCIPAEGGMYNVVLRVTEGTASIMEIRLQVPDKALAEEICRKWPEKNEQIYNSLIENLF
jgi:DNA-binding PadR family transcriptional regulator